MHAPFSHIVFACMCRLRVDEPLPCEVGGVTAAASLHFRSHRFVWEIRRHYVRPVRRFNVDPAAFTHKLPAKHVFAATLRSWREVARQAAVRRQMQVRFNGHIVIA